MCFSISHKSYHKACEGWFVDSKCIFILITRWFFSDIQNTYKKILCVEAQRDRIPTVLFLMGKKLRWAKRTCILFCRMKMSLPQHSLLSKCVSLKEKGCRWGRQMGGDPPCRYFTNILTKENVTCYLSFGFRELICIEMSHLQENR